MRITEGLRSLSKMSDWYLQAKRDHGLQLPTKVVWVKKCFVWGQNGLTYRI